MRLTLSLAISISTFCTLASAIPEYPNKLEGFLYETVLAKSKMTFTSSDPENCKRKAAGTTVFYNCTTPDAAAVFVDQKGNSHRFVFKTTQIVLQPKFQTGDTERQYRFFGKGVDDPMQTNVYLVFVHLKSNPKVIDGLLRIQPFDMGAAIVANPAD